MSKFVIACPVCHQYVQASTGLFASRRVRCACGNIIDVKTERLASRKCPSCGNQVVFDQADGVDARCPVCQSALMVGEAVSFRCHRCGCQLNADSTVDEVDCPVCGAVNDVQAEVKKAQVRAEGIPAVIRYEGDNQTIVWKHPLTDFTTGTQLIVHESQEAVFFRNGEALDSFGAGRYTLETATLPKMNSIYQLPTQGTPFRAEVYFVNLTTQLGIKWGTPSKVGMFDPVTGIHVELGASGAFNLRVSDARRLLIRVVGTAAGLKQEEVFNQNGLGYFRTLIMTQVKANLAKIIKSNHISVLELDEHLDTISRGLRDAINAELASYGLEVPEFYVSNIVTPDDDPNFRRMKQQHADLYLKTRDEEIRKAEAEAAFERKAVEAQTEARLKTITAQGDADAARIAGQAQADIYRMQAEAEAQEMRMKGYTYQQETSRQVGLEAMRNGDAVRRWAGRGRQRHRHDEGRDSAGDAERLDPGSSRSRGLDVHLRQGGHHEQILPGMRREEARSVGLRVRADGHHEQILPELRCEKARNVELRLRTGEHQQQILPELRQEAGGLSNETEQARMDNLGDSSGGGTCADGADSVQPDGIVVDCGYLHRADVLAGGVDVLCRVPQGWLGKQDPGLADFQGGRGGAGGTGRSRLCADGAGGALPRVGDGAGGGADFRRDGHLPDGEGCRAHGGIAERSAHGGQHRRVEGHPAEGERAVRIGGCGHEAPCGGNSLRRPDAHEPRRGDCSAGGCAGGGGEREKRSKFA